MCISFVEDGDFDRGYDNNVHIVRKNCKTFDFRERGQRKQALFGNAQTACVDDEGDHQAKDPEYVIARRRQTAKR